MTKRHLESLSKQQQDEILGLPPDEWVEDAENEPEQNPPLVYYGGHLTVVNESRLQEPPWDAENEEEDYTEAQEEDAWWARMLLDVEGDEQC